VAESAPNFLFGHLRQNFQTECRSYNSMAYLMAAFLFMSILFTMPYIVYSSKR
jgi:hypothetical protein